VDANASVSQCKRVWDPEGGTTNEHEAKSEKSRKAEEKTENH